MTDNIIINRDNTTHIVKLTEEEQDVLNEIEINQDSPPARRPVSARPFRPPPKPQQHQREPQMDAFMNPNKRNHVPPPMEEPEDLGEEEYQFDDEPEQMEEGEEPTEGYTSIDDEKADLLNKISRLEKKGFNVNKKLNIYSSVSDLRMEYKRITYTIEVDSSVKFSRRMLVACVSGLEFINKRYNPVDVYLEGWSESIVENMDDYDGVFEDLYNKYKTKMDVAPEVKLIMMLGGSAMMFHLTNSMFKSAVPNMNDVLKKNPELVKNMVDAVKQNTTAPPPPTTDSNGRHEMRGPGIDLQGLMGGMMPMPIAQMPPPPTNTSNKISTLTPVEEESDDDESVSDIVSISGESTGGEVRDVRVTNSKRKRKKKNEITL